MQALCMGGQYIKIGSKARERKLKPIAKKTYHINDFWSK
jgi:hypothetical protein